MMAQRAVGVKYAVENTAKTSFERYIVFVKKSGVDIGFGIGGDKKECRQKMPCRVHGLLNPVMAALRQTSYVDIIKLSLFARGLP